ncbi:MAG TPA: YhjD/YihY/BrkB family envelope integrity protein [Thermoleophilaceae bacterium]
MPATEKVQARVEAARAVGERQLARAQRLRWAPAVLESLESEQRSGAGLLAGGLAYRLFFWLVSFGLVVAAAASFWVRADQRSMVSTAKDFGLSGVAAKSAASAVQSGSHSRWYLLAVGFVLMLYFGVGAVRALRVASFVAWRIKPTRMRHSLKASGTFTGIFVLALIAVMFTSWVRQRAALAGVVVTVMVIAVFAAMALLAFLLLPRAERTGWKELLPGAVVVGAGITGIHVFVVYYLADKLERSPKLYGALGASTVVLLGLYLMARVTVSAMFLNSTLEQRRGLSSDRGDEAEPLPTDALSSDG